MPRSEIWRSILCQQKSMIITICSGRNRCCARKCAGVTAALQKTAANYEKLVLTLECSVEASCEGDCKVNLTDWLVEVWGDGFCRAVKPEKLVFIWCLSI